MAYINVHKKLPLMNHYFAIILAINEFGLGLIDTNSYDFRIERIEVVFNRDLAIMETIIRHNIDVSNNIITDAWGPIHG